MRKSLRVLTIAMILAACSTLGSDGSTTTQVAPGTSSPETTVTAPESTTTTDPDATTTTTTANTTTTIDPLAPQGSGCTPGTEGDLPDGVWYGGVREFDADGISFDLACLFSGDAATAAAAEDGEESPPPNDYYVRNENDLVRQLIVAPDTPVTWYTSGDPNDEASGTFPEWIDFLSTQESYLGIFVTIEDGEVTEISERWVP